VGGSVMAGAMANALGDASDGKRTRRS
jgi:hypothetical protein